MDNEGVLGPQSPLIIGGLAVTTIAYGICRILKIPFSVIGLAVGASSLPPIMITTFIGALIGKYLIPKLIGKEEWENNKLIFVAGVGCGEGVVVGIASALMMIIKGGWILPW